MGWAAPSPSSPVKSAGCSGHDAMPDSPTAPLRHPDGAFRGSGNRPKVSLLPSELRRKRRDHRPPGRVLIRRHRRKIVANKGGRYEPASSEHVVLRFELDIACDPGSNPTGNLQAVLLSASVIAPTNQIGAIRTGSQTIPLYAPLLALVAYNLKFCRVSERPDLGLRLRRSSS